MELDEPAVKTHYDLYGKAYYEKHKEKELKRAKESYQKNRDKMKLKYLSKRDEILQRRYGITEGQYDLMFIKQDGCCAICDQRHSKRLDVDHCHTTGIVRGLLCNNCNRGIGHLKDDVGILLNAADYLVRSQSCGS